VSHGFGSAHDPHVGARTVDFWSGAVTVNGTTYPYQMVGGDPADEQGSVIKVDVVAVDLKVGGTWFRGSDAVDPLLASPIFQGNDYRNTSHASTAAVSNRQLVFPVGAGGDVSAGNTDAQVLDATMRAQFDKVGTDYHVYLDPSASHKAVEMVVPASHGAALWSGMGVATASVDEFWLMPNIESLAASLHYLEPHRLALFLTKDVLLYADGNPMHPAAFGEHGSVETTAEGNGSDGRDAIQTYVWSSWLTPGLFRTSTRWAMQDVYGLSHEVVEWATDPFLTNQTPHWRSPIAPQYGCSGLLETGDPVAGLGFATGVNDYLDPADPHASATNPHGSGDGSYHLSEEVLLPWFFGPSSPSSQPSQGSSGGRFTFLGDLNPFGFFHAAASRANMTGC
jgi:hypothetical protein